MQITELELYDVTESCPIQFLSHSSVVSLVNLHLNIKTLVLRYYYFTSEMSECIDCALTRGTYQLHKLCGRNLNWTIHISYYNQGVTEN